MIFGTAGYIIDAKGIEAHNKGMSYFVLIVQYNNFQWNGTFMVALAIKYGFLKRTWIDIYLNILKM